VPDKGLRARFGREGNLLLKLSHPGIQPVRSAHFDDDPPYLVLEAVPGEDLGALLARHGALSTRQALSVVARLCETLAYLHEHGRFHRDLKPTSLVVDGDKVLVTDFGVAREVGKGRLTQPGMFVGTIEYAPPEWSQPDGVEGNAWDLYALGVLLHEMLIGGLPYTATAAPGTMDRAVQVTLQKRAAEHLDPGDGVPDEVRALVRALTARDPAARPKSVTEVRDRVLALLGDGGLTPAPPPSRTPPPSPKPAPLRPPERPTVLLPETPPLPPPAARTPRSATPRPAPPAPARTPPPAPIAKPPPARSPMVALVAAGAILVVLGGGTAVAFVVVALVAAWVLA
jgi:serine/threonine protein kinase